MMTPTPHRYPTLLVYDILFRVFFYLGEFKGTLRSAGLVCQAWYEPAMDVLWAENIFLHHLLAILSPMEIKGDGWRNIAFFTRPPTPQSWSRFRFLAQKVKQATLQSPALDPTLVSELLSKSAHSGPLLPSVRRLVLHTENIRHALMWMHSAVDSLEFFQVTEGRDGIEWDMEMSEFVAEMARLCPNLKTLEIGGKGAVAETVSIGGLRNLRTVDLGEGDVTAVFLELAKLPAVERLIIHTLPNLPLQWPQSGVTPFPKLEVLNIYYPSNSETATFLHTLAEGESHLRELGLGDDGDLDDLGTIIRAAGKHRYLERIEIYAYDDTTALSLDTLTPILSCGFLIDLKLYFNGDVSMVDEDLATLGHGLPKLVHFVLEGHTSSSTLTLRALSIAVTVWPSLETLSLKVDTSGPLPSENHTPHMHLRMLHLSYSHEPKVPMEMASFIAGLSDADGFQLICHARGPWRQVVELLPEMRKERLEVKSKGTAQGFMMAFWSRFLNSASEGADQKALESNLLWGYRIA
ncbi:hypothetical protein FRB93_012563 [Tulasnella sp. JGI-2019a]|nr:hypothetical protein FRB93_012563 [Tulasnella sp. JGI-2019a]